MAITILKSLAAETATAWTYTLLSQGPRSNVEIAWGRGEGIISDLMLKSLLKTFKNMLPPLPLPPPLSALAAARSLLSSLLLACRPGVLIIKLR